jgi:hypothetical protein
MYITFKWNIVKAVRQMKGHMHAMVWDSISILDESVRQNRTYVTYGMHACILHWAF